MDKLYIVSGKYELLSLGLKDQPTYIGRSPENDIQIRDNYVSRKHLELYKKGDKHFIKDLNSANGTFVNGKRIGSKVGQGVKEGDTIVIGMTLICLGESCSERVLSFLDSVEPNRAFGDTNTFVQKGRTTSPQQTRTTI
jgi:pSer/pThr/pTyr-binding forkhead associated (FHA) protein